MSSKSYSVEVNDNGSITVSDMIDGSRVAHTYYGYSHKQAIKEFTETYYEE